MKQILFIFFFISSVCLQINAQNNTLKLSKQYNLDADMFIGVDKFDNLYYVKNNSIFKVRDIQNPIAFQDFLLGDIDRVDILNPNKIIVFYKLSNTVIILDNRMTEIDRQDFNRLSPFKNVAFAGTSKDQSLWIYNIDLNQLELYDYRYNKLLAQSLPIEAEILEMKNNFNYCFLRTSSSILIFNIYGSLLKKLEFDNIKSFDLYKNQLIVHTGDKIQLYGENFEMVFSSNFDIDTYKNLFYNDENLYLYDGKSVLEYSMISKK